MKERLNRTIASVLILVNVVTMLPAREFDVGRQAGMTRLEHSLDRAAKERNPESWQRIAEEGLSLAVIEWENRTVSMKESDPAAWQRQKDLVAGEYTAVAGKEYASWLGDRFFEERAQVQTGKMSRELEEKAAAWQYTGADGTYTRVISAADATSAREQWRATVSAGVIDAYLEAWEKETGADYPEIMAYLSDSGLSYADIGGLVAGKKNSYAAYVREEYERVAAAEENALVMSLLYDQNSLKKKSAEEAAKIIAGRIAGEAKEATTADIDRIFSLMESEIESQKADGVEIDTDSWLASFRASFERNLAKWDDAEREFLVARADWEKDASKVYLDSEQVWANAYAELKAEQRKWQKEIEARFDTGIQKWADEESALNATIEAARDEFVAAAKQERSKTEQVVDLQISVYNQSREMVSMAMQGVNYWYERWGSVYRNAYPYWKTNMNDDDPPASVWDMRTLKAANPRAQIVEFKKTMLAKFSEPFRQYYSERQTQYSSISDSVESIERQIAELTKSMQESGPAAAAFFKSQIDALNDILSTVKANRDALAAMLAKCDAAEKKINALDLTSMSGNAFASAVRAAVAEFGISLGDFADADAWDASSELVSWLDLVDKYDEGATTALRNLYAVSGGTFDAGSTDGYLDELSVELLKAKAVAGYWKNELDIARAVDEYATTTSSGAESSSETKAALQAAKNAYDVAFDSYNKTVAELDSRKDSCAESETKLENAKSALDAERTKVEEARAQYNTAVLALKDIGEVAIKQKIIDLIVSLNDSWTKTAESESKALLSYYEKALSYAQAQTEKEANDVIKGLVNGNSEYNSLSLVDLRKKRDAAKGYAESSLQDQRNNIGEIPTEYSALKALMLEQIGIANDSSVSSERRDLAKSIVADGWRAVEAYWASQITERESAVKYILTGETGLEDSCLTADVAARQNAIETETWISTQKKLLESQLALLVRLDDPGARGSDEDKSAYQAYLAEKSGLDTAIAILSNALAADASGRAAVLNAQRNANAYVSSILKMKSPFDAIVPGWSQYLYELNLSGTKAATTDMQDKIVSTYEPYAYRAINKKNTDARIAVDAIIRERITDKVPGSDTVRRIDTVTLADKITSLPEGATDPSVYALIDDLEKAGEGLNPAGKDALEKFISGVLEYVAAKFVYTTGAAYPKTSESIKAEYNAALSIYNECAQWQNTVYSYEALLETALSPSFATAVEMKAKAELQAALADYLAYLIVDKLSRADIESCASKADVFAMFASNTYAASVGNEKLLKLDVATRDRIATTILELFGNTDSVYAANKAYVAWMKLASDDLTRKSDEWINDTQIERYFSAIDLIPEVQKSDANKAAIGQNREYRYLEEVLASGISDDLAKAINLANLETLVAKYNAAADYVASYNAEAKNANDRLEPIAKIGDVKVYLVDRLADYLVRCPAEIPKSALDSAAVISLIARELVSKITPVIEKYKAPDEKIQDYCTDSKYAETVDSLVAENERNLLDAESAKLARYVADNDCSSVYDSMIKYDQTLWPSAFLPYALGGQNLLYAYLLSPDGSADIASALPLLEMENVAMAADVRSYYNVQTAIADYSSILDGPISGWLANWTSASGAKLTEAEKARVMTAVETGLDDKGSIYWREEYNAELKPALASSTRLMLLQSGGRDRLVSAMNAVAAEKIPAVSRLQCECQLANFAEAELKNNRLSWATQAKAEKLKETTGTTDDEKKVLDSTLGAEGASVDLTAVALARISDRLRKLGDFFTSLETSGDLKFNIVAITSGDPPTVDSSLIDTYLKDTWTYAGNQDTGANELDKAWTAYRSLTQSELIGVNYINQSLNTLALLRTSRPEREQKVKETESALKAAEAAFAAKQNAYTAAAEKLTDAYGGYNAQVAVVQSAWDAAERAKTERAKKQETYDWATSVYLGNIGSASGDYKTPKEKLTEVEYASLRADLAVSVLASLTQDGAALVGNDRGKRDASYAAELARYEIACKNYYLSRALQYETDKEIARMKDEVRQAENAERNALSRLVSPNVGTADLPMDKLDLVRLVRNADGTYSLSLAYDVNSDGTGVIAATSVAANDAAILSAYFNEKTVAVSTIDGDVKTTQSASDAFDWLSSMNSRGDSDSYLDDLGLAALYLLSADAQTNPSKKENLFNGNDPLDNDSYAIDVISTDKLHGFAVNDEYHNARLSVLKSAYESVTRSATGKADLAKYLLYRDTSLSGQNFDKTEKTELALRAREIVKAHMKDAIANKYDLGVISGLTAEAYAVLAMFCASHLDLVGAIYFGVLIVGCVTVSITALCAVNDLSEVVDDFDIRQGALTVDKNNGIVDRNQKYIDWENAKASLTSKQKTLNAYIGKTPDGRMKYSDFTASVDMILNASNGTVKTGDYKSVFTEDVFRAGMDDAQKAGKATGSTLDMIAAVSERLAKTKAEAKTSLEEKYVKKLKDDQSFAIDSFAAARSETMEISAADKTELKILSATANDITRSIGERAAASAAYDKIVAKINSDANTDKIRNELETIALTAFGKGSWYQRDFDEKIIAIEKSMADTYTAHDRSTEGYVSDNLTAMKEAIMTAMSNAQASRFAVREVEWKLALQNLAEQKSAWYEQAVTIQRLSNLEWVKADGKINAGYKDWKTEFGKTYAARTSAWEENYNEFLTGKQDWITDQYLYATNVANGKALAASGTNVEAAIAKTMQATLAENRSMVDAAFDSSTYVKELLGATSLSRLMDYAANLEDRSSGSAALIKRGTALGANHLDSIASATVALTAIGEHMRKTSSVLAAKQAQKQFSLMQKQYSERLTNENKGMADWEESLVLNSGYTTGAEYSRNAIVDSTLAGTVREKQTVHKYVNYIAPGATISVSLDEGNLKGLDDYGIMMMISQAQSELEAYGERIYGKADEEGGTKQWQIPRTKQDAAAKDYANIEADSATQTMVNALKEAEKKDYDALSDDEKEAYTETINSLITIRDGEFGQYTGFAPLFKSGEDLKLDKSRESNIEYNGKGEIGSIMLDFQWNSMMQGKGYGELGRPVYDKRMWDDRGSDIKAPTVRVVTDIAANIISKVSGCEFVAYIDDLIFAGVDLAGGYKTPEQVGKALAVQAVGAAVGAGAKELTNMAGGLQGAGKIFADIGIAGLSSGANTVAGAFINNMDFSKIGTSEWFDGDSFANSMTNPATWASTVAAMAGAGVTSALGQLNMGNQMEIKTADGKTVTGYTKIDGFNQKQIGDILTMNKLAGGLTSSAVTYGMTGNVKFNVASFMETGLLELNLGKDGFSMTLGMGGTDVSAGTIASTLRGAEDWGVNNAIENAAARDNMTDAATAMRLQWGYSDAVGVAQLLSIIDGSTRLLAGTGTKEGQTERIGDTRYVTLMGYKEGMSREDQLMMGLVLQHEAYRDGIKDARNVAETESAVYHHTEMALRLGNDGLYQSSMTNLVNGSDNLKADLTNYFKSGGNRDSFAKYVDGTYDSSADYWRKKLNGTIVRDANIYLTEEYRDDNGKLADRVVEGSRDENSMSAALVHYLGAARSVELLGRGPGLDSNDLKESLSDVFKLSPAQMQEVLASKDGLSNLLRDATPIQRDKILGESLMKSYGLVWDEKAGWTGNGSFSMTDMSLPDGAINTIKLIDGSYKNTTIALEVVRNIKGFKVYKNDIPDTYDAQVNYLNDAAVLAGNKNNTTFNFVQRDMDGNVLNMYNPQKSMSDMRINSVDIIRTSLGGTDIPSTSILPSLLGWGKQQGSTVISDFTVEMTSLSKDKPKWGLAEGDMVFQFTSGTTLNGGKIGLNGVVPGEQLRTLIHPSGYGNSDNCFIPYSSFGGAAAAGANFRTMTDYLRNNWGLKPYTTITGNLRHSW